MSEIASLVQPIETTCTAELATSYQSYRVSLDPEAWSAAEKLYDWLSEEGEPPFLERLHSCRSQAWFARHEETGNVRVVTSTCKLRWCPLCGSARRNWIASQVREWLNDRPMAKFVTLTLKHSDLPISDQLSKLRSCFLSLRRSVFFRRKCHGGIWFLQVKKSKKTQQWHPHLHCLINSEFIDRRALSAKWEQITTDSPVSDIRLVVDDAKAAGEVARYCSAPCRLPDLNICDAIELHYALMSKRMCGTWGDGRSILLRPPKSDDYDKWKNVGDWQSVTAAANRHPAAKLILQSWKNQTVLPAGITFSSFDEKSQKSMVELFANDRSQPYLDFYHST